MLKRSPFGLILSALLLFIGTPILAQIQSTPQVESVPQIEKYLVNIKKLDPTIIVDLKYASGDNVFNKKFYSGNTAYLRPKVARRLVRVQKHLRKKGKGLKIWDAYRPYTVQKLLWGLKPDVRYMADPQTGSVNNRGAAVDVTLVDEKGKELKMPTGFNDFTERAYRNYKGGTWTSRHNRNTLRRAMEKFGFLSVETEWWHFNDIDAGNYDILDFPL